MDTVTPASAYEKPTPTGWSMKIMLAWLFHEWGLRSVELPSFCVVQGPLRSSNRVSCPSLRSSEGAIGVALHCEVKPDQNRFIQ